MKNKFIICLGIFVFLYFSTGKVFSQGICDPSHPSCGDGPCYCSRTLTVGDGCVSATPPCQTRYVNVNNSCWTFPYCESSAVGLYCLESGGACVEAPEGVFGECCGSPSSPPGGDDCSGHSAPPSCGNYGCGPGRSCRKRESDDACVCRCDSSSADLKIEVNGGAQEDGPVTVNIGDSYRLSWTSDNVESCTLDGMLVDNNAAITRTLVPGVTSHTFALVCDRPGSCGSASDSLTVDVNGPPPVVASTCDISVWPLNPLACGQSFNVTYSGNANRSGTYPVRLYLNKDDYRELPLPNPGTEITFYDASQLRDLFFYQVDTCNTIDGAACTRTVTVNNVSASGGYHLFCDVTTNAPGQCSGDGACTYEGGWLNCGSLYQSCSSTDRRTFSTTSVPPTPLNFAGSCNQAGTAVNLTWSDVAGETGYRITRNPAFGPPIPTLGVDRPANTTSYTDNSIASEVPPVAHQYYLQSFNACGVAPIPAVISGGVGACIVYEAWFQAEGGDVISATGNVEATVPTTAPTPYLVANPAWDAGASSYPTVFGIPGASGNLSSSNVSLAGLLVNFSTGAPPSNWSSLSTKPDNSYVNISARVISRYSAQVVTDTDISELDMALIVSSALSSNHKVVPALSGYGVPSGNDLEVAVIQLAPNPPGPVTIQGMQFLGTQTNRGAIIFAEGTVNISGNITVDDSNFLAIISGGNINVSAAAGSGPTPTASPYQYPVGLGTYEPHLKGVFYAQGDFNTGIDSDQLKIEGIVVGLNLVNLQRTSTGPHPAEYFKYNPKYAGILREIGLRRKVHYERVAP